MCGSVLVPTFSLTDMAACSAEDLASFYKGFLWGANDEKRRNRRKAVWLTRGGAVLAVPRTVTTWKG